jgi:hypothetical protein
MITTIEKYTDINNADDETSAMGVKITNSANDTITIELMDDDWEKISEATFNKESAIKLFTMLLDSIKNS